MVPLNPANPFWTIHEDGSRSIELIPKTHDAPRAWWQRILRRKPKLAAEPEPTFTLWISSGRASK